MSNHPSGTITQLDDAAAFAEAMLVTMRQAGAAARLMQGRVANEGKEDGTQFPTDDEALRMRRAAKTLADEVAQEIILLGASEILAGSSARLDAEEATPSTVLFSGAATARQTLVIDPIDGTVEYCEGKNSYSVCVGLERAGDVLVALVYFPARDAMYRYVAGEAPTVFEDLSRAVQARPLTSLPSTVTEGPIVYKNGRVRPETVRSLERAGFSVRDDTENQIGAPDAILACLRGEAIAYVSHTRQMRDVLLGAVVGGLPAGGAFDWSGRCLRWPQGGRVPRAVFMADSTYAENLWPCLASDAEPGA